MTLQFNAMTNKYIGHLMFVIHYRIRIFGWKKGKPLAVLNYHSSTVNTCSFLPNTASTKSSNLIVCGSKDERVSMWKIY